MEDRNNEIARLSKLFDYYTPYFRVDGRLASFTKKWPHKKPNLTPLKMAEAGFYYSPDRMDKDCVKCPFCLKELSGWEDDDDPMEEHRRYKSGCYFARLDKREEDYTVRDVMLLLCNTRAAVLEKETYESLALAEEAYKRMVEKAARQIGKLCIDVGASAAIEGDEKDGRKSNEVARKGRRKSKGNAKRRA